jgi:hypothetical protein
MVKDYDTFSGINLRKAAHQIRRQAGTLSSYFGSSETGADNDQDQFQCGSDQQPSGSDSGSGSGSESESGSKGECGEGMEKEMEMEMEMEKEMEMEMELTAAGVAQLKLRYPLANGPLSVLIDTSQDSLAYEKARMASMTRRYLTWNLLPGLRLQGALSRCRVQPSYLQLPGYTQDNFSTSVNPRSGQVRSGQFRSGQVRSGIGAR